MLLALVEEETARLELDFSDVTFVDSSGLGVVVCALSATRRPTERRHALRRRGGGEQDASRVVAKERRWRSR